MIKHPSSLYSSTHKSSESLKISVQTIEVCVKQTRSYIIFPEIRSFFSSPPAVFFPLSFLIVGIVCR